MLCALKSIQEKLVRGLVGHAVFACKFVAELHEGAGLTYLQFRERASVVACNNNVILKGA